MAELFENTELNPLSGDQQIEMQSPDVAMEAPTLQAPAIEPTISDTDPPPAQKSDNFQSKMNALVDDSVKRHTAPKDSSLEHELLDAKGANVKYHAPSVVDKYKAQEGFNPNFYEAEDNKYNQEEAIRNETFGIAMGKAFDSFAFSFGNTFTGWFKDYPKMVDAIFSADWEKMKPDEASLIDEYYLQQKNMNENYVFVPEDEEDDIFSKKFMSEFVGNAGFAMGTVAAMSLEFLADAAITAATEGLGGASLLSLGSRASAKAAAREASREAIEATAKTGAAHDFFKGFNVASQPVEDVTKAFSSMRQAHQAESVAALAASPTRTRRLISEYANIFSNNIFNIGKSKNLTEFVGNTLKGTPLLGTGIRYGEKMVAAGKAGASTASMLGMGAQGVRRLMQELNMSASEAYFESVSSYGDTLDKAYKQHMADTGEPPNQELFEDMKRVATKSSSNNYDTNMGILLVTNHLQFGNLFNRYIPANKVVKDLMAESSERIISITGKNGLQGVVKKSALFGTARATGRIASEFGKKEAAYQLGKSVLKDVARFELVEGLQENLQEMSASGWKDYYAGQINGTKYTLNDAMMNGMKQQFTKQGWKTFLMGAMTGSLIRTPTQALNVGVEQANKFMLQNQYKKEGAINPYDAYEKRLDDDIAILNKFIKTAKTGSFEDRLFNFNTQTSTANDLTVAANAGAAYNFENGKDNALLATVAAANRIGTIDAFLQSVKSTIADMNAEDFKKEFGIDIEDTKYSSPQEFAEKVTADVKKYSKNMDEFKRKYQTKFEDYSKYEPGSEDFITSRYIRHAEEEALHIAALNSIKADMTLQRAESVANELRKNPILANSTDTVLRTLSNKDAIIADLGNIQASIKVLEDNLKQEGLTPKMRKDSKAQIKALTEEADALIKWHGFYDTRAKLAEREGRESTDHSPVFVGRRSHKRSRHKNVGGIIHETNNVYNTQHREVLAAFKKVLLAKNKQAGIEVDIKDSQVEEALAQLVDYIQLDTDTRDYLQTVEVLTDKDNFKKVTKNLQNGYYKHKLIVYNDTFFNTFTQALADISTELNKTKGANISQADYDQFVANVQKELLSYGPYIELTAIISDPHLGLEKQKEVAEHQQKIDEFIKKKFDTFVQEHTKNITDKGISDAEYAQIIKNDDLGYIRTIAMAHKIIKLNNDLSKLTEREKELYEKFKETVDLKIAEIKESMPAEAPPADTPVAETNDPVSTGDEEVIIDDGTEEDEETFSPTSFAFNQGEETAEEEFEEVTEEEEVEDEEEITEDLGPKEEPDFVETETTETPLTPDLAEKMFRMGVMDVNHFQTFIITEKVKSFIDNEPIQDLQTVVQNVISEIAHEAGIAGESFIDFVKANETFVNKTIEHHIVDSNEGADTTTDELIVEEPEVIVTEAFDDKEDIKNFKVDLEDVREINTVLNVKELTDAVDVVNIGNVDVNAENITNFTESPILPEDNVTEQSIIEKLKSNKFKC